ncbi:MAG: peptidase M20 [Herpetosiphonaceae bacterium]|nr:MAG: peptidase M20 [Herpetosiphonaceae bacterium]
MPTGIPPGSLEPVLAWIDARHEAAIADLQRFCRQPSVAAQGWGMDEMADLVVEALEECGASTSLVPTAGFPVVVGRLKGAGSRHLAIYNHYDVQPPEPLEAWSSPPFEAQIRDGVLYARGVADNKGNLVARLWAVRAWRAVHGTLPCNITFLVEGEEEIGSPHLAEFAAANQELVRADACLWEAGYRDPGGAPVLYAGLKGMLYVELHTRGVAFDLHSSQAPLAPSAAWRLVAALQSLRDPDGRVCIPGFYDAVRPPTERERELMRRYPIDGETMRRLWQVERLLGSSDDPAALTEQLLFEPTCNICGLWSGYSGSGTKTILPATAGAKLDFRLVPDQDPATILDLLRRHLADQGFGDVEVIELEGSERPAQSPVDTPLMEALISSAQRVYGAAPRVLPRMAATGPMEQLCQRYGVPAIGGAGVGHPGSRVHAPDENIRIEDFILAIKHIAALLLDFAG